MKTGTEDKKKIIILAAMLAVIIPAAIWELSGYFSSPAPRPAVPAQVTTAPRPASATTTAPATATGPEAPRVNSSNNLDPTLHLDKLAQSEEVEYAGTGRNIFSAESAPPVTIPTAVTNGRDTATVVVPQAPPVPTAPAIDLKYFGYSQSKDKSNIRAFLVHGEDIFMAKSGEIVDHRYKIATSLRAASRSRTCHTTTRKTCPSCSRSGRVLKGHEFTRAE
jgi:hypothetical protein